MINEDIPGVILAGGRSSRMGVPDKCLLPLNGKLIIEHVIDVLRPQVGDILVNTNSNHEQFQKLNVSVRKDILPGQLGPLAGIHTAMMWAREQGAEDVVTVPADTPFLPADVVARLHSLKKYKRIVTLSDEYRVHPTIALWPIHLADRLAAYIVAGGRSIQAWLRVVGSIEHFYPAGGIDPFFNLNTPDDLARAASVRQPGAREVDHSANLACSRNLERERLGTGQLLA